MQYKILVVDDHVDNLKIMINYLQNQSIKLDLLQSNSAIKALEIARDTRPDLIITDWDMPQLDGLDFIKALKKSTVTKDIPVIMATGVMLSATNLKLALDAGAVDYLRKPIDPVELQARVNSALTIAEYHRKAIEAKNHELAENAVLMIKHNQFSLELKNQLFRLLNVVSSQSEASNLVKQLVELVESHVRMEDYGKFELAFNEVHPNFLKNLVYQFPDLSSAEIKLCTFIRLGMNIKDVASVLHLNPDSVKVARSRLRKKLNLDTSQNIENFMMNF